MAKSTLKLHLAPPDLHTFFDHFDLRRRRAKHLQPNRPMENRTLNKSEHELNN